MADRAPSTIDLDTTDGPMGAFVAEPGGVPRGGIVVLQEAFGLTDHIGRVCSRFAEAGWLAIAPALFHRTGSPVLDYEDIPSVMPHMAALSAETLADDLGPTLAWLAGRSGEGRGGDGQGGAAPGIVGFCMGGTVALWAATELEVGAAVSYYGGGVSKGRFGLPPLVDLAPSLRCPWMGHYGGRDQGIPLGEAEALGAAATTAPVPTEMHLYPEAGHGFNCDDREAFHPEASSLAWGRTVDWFGRHLR